MDIKKWKVETKTALKIVSKIDKKTKTTDKQELEYKPR